MFNVKVYDIKEKKWNTVLFTNNYEEAVWRCQEEKSKGKLSIIE